MKIRYIIKTMLIEMNRSVGGLIITILMLTISFSMILFEATVYGDYVYRVVHNQTLLSVDSQQLYNINTEYYKIFWNNEELKNYYAFIMGLNSPENNMRSGMYYPTLLNEEEALCISGELMPIGNLQDIDGAEIDLQNEQSVAVGYELRNKYPIGTIIQDELYGTQYQVEQILAKNSEWLGADASTGIQTSIKLDNAILLDTEGHMEQSGYMDVLNAANNSYFYHPTMSEEEANQYIHEYAASMGIRVYDSMSLRTQTLKKLVEAYRNESVELIFVVTGLALSIVGQYLAVIINLEYRRRNFGVLLASKWTRRDVIKMSVIECSIRIIISLGIAIPVAYNLVKNMSGNSDTESFFWMLPGLLIVVIIFNFCCNRVIHKRVNQYSVRKMLEGRNWK